MNRLNELDSSTNTNSYIHSKLVIQQQLQSIEKDRYSLLTKQKEIVEQELLKYKETDVEWVALNKQLEDYNEKLEDSNYKIQEMVKTIDEIELSSILKPFEDMIKEFNEDKERIKLFNEDKQADEIAKVSKKTQVVLEEEINKINKAIENVRLRLAVETDSDKIQALQRQLSMLTDKRYEVRLDAMKGSQDAIDRINKYNNALKENLKTQKDMDKAYEEAKMKQYLENAGVGLDSILEEIDQLNHQMELIDGGKSVKNIDIQLDMPKVNPLSPDEAGKQAEESKNKAQEEIRTSIDDMKQFTDNAMQEFQSFVEDKKKSTPINLFDDKVLQGVNKDNLSVYQSSLNELSTISSMSETKLAELVRSIRKYGAELQLPQGTIEDFVISVTSPLNGLIEDLQDDSDRISDILNTNVKKKIDDEIRKEEEKKVILVVNGDTEKAQKQVTDFFETWNGEEISLEIVAPIEQVTRDIQKLITTQFGSINIPISYSTNPTPAYANGTSGHKGGLAIVGDKYGRELLKYPNGQMELTGDKAELRNLPQGTQVIPNKETEDILKAFGVPFYASGTYFSGLGSLEDLAKFIKEFDIMKYSWEEYTEIMSEISNAKRGNRFQAYGQELSSLKNQLKNNSNTGEVESIKDRINSLNSSMSYSKEYEQYINQLEKKIWTASGGNGLDGQANLKELLSGNSSSGSKGNSGFNSKQASYDMSWLKPILNTIDNTGSDLTTDDILTEKIKLYQEVITKGTSIIDELKTQLKYDGNGELINTGEDGENNLAITKKISELLKSQQSAQKLIKQTSKDIVDSKIKQFEVEQKIFSQEQDNIEELNKRNELFSNSDRYLDNKLIIQKQIKQNEKDNYALLEKQRQSIIDQMATVEKGSYEWELLNGHLDNYNEKLEDSNYKLLEINKNIFDTQAKKNLSEREKLIFNGISKDDVESQLKKDKADFEDRKSQDSKHLSGLEKEYSLELLKRSIYETNDETLKATYKSMEEASVINKNDYETLKKKLNIKELEIKLQNLQNEKTVKTIKQLEDGSYNFEYTVDQDQVDKVQDELKQAQIDFSKWEKDLAFEQEQEYLNQREKVLQSQNEYLEELKKLQENALNGQYATQEEYAKAMEKINSKLCTEYKGEWAEVLKSQLDNKEQAYFLEFEMEAHYGAFINNIKQLTAELTSHIMEQSNIVQNTVSEIIDSVKESSNIKSNIDLNVNRNVTTWGQNSPLNLNGNNMLNTTMKQYDIQGMLTSIKGLDLLNNNISTLKGLDTLNSKIVSNTIPSDNSTHYTIESLTMECPEIKNADDMFEGLSRLARLVK